MVIFDQDHRPPEPTEADALHRATEATLALIPGVGVVASRLFGSVFAPPLERRRREWMGTSPPLCAA
jgi:hypothetical protein